MDHGVVSRLVESVSALGSKMRKVFRTNVRVECGTSRRHDFIRISGVWIVGRRDKKYTPRSHALYQVVNVEFRCEAGDHL